jgi:hypothetical protein
VFLSAFRQFGLDVRFGTSRKKSRFSLSEEFLGTRTPTPRRSSHCSRALPRRVAPEHAPWSSLGRARSPRGAARVALCLVALLAAASVASAVSFSETDKRSAHESHHARKARLQEEVAAAELATREKYEAKMSSLERTTERLRREAEETVASLSAERDALSRNLTKYKRGLLNLDAKRKSEAETLRAETERLRAEREELQAKLEQALDDALSATKAAADAKRESRAIARAAKAEGGASDETKRKIDEILTGASSSSSAGIGLVAGVVETVSGALARAARAGRALRPRNALRVVAVAARDKGWLPVAASATDDDAVACRRRRRRRRRAGRARREGPRRRRVARARRVLPGLGEGAEGELPSPPGVERGVCRSADSFASRVPEWIRVVRVGGDALGERLGRVRARRRRRFESIASGLTHPRRRGRRAVVRRVPRGVRALAERIGIGGRGARRRCLGARRRARRKRRSRRLAFPGVRTRRGRVGVSFRRR